MLREFRAHSIYIVFENISGRKTLISRLVGVDYTWIISFVGNIILGVLAGTRKKIIPGLFHLQAILFSEC